MRAQKRLPAAELRESLSAALEEIRLAETALEAALDAIKAGREAEKVVVTTAVVDAFARLRAAHSELVRLRDRVAAD